MSDAASAFDLKTKYDKATCQVVEVLKKADPVRIIRFGSAAWGTLHEHSDLDLCVVVERTDQRSLQQIRRDLNMLLWEQCRPREIEIQLHVYYRDIFEDYLRREDPFLHEVVKGEVVYELPIETRELLKDSSFAYGPSRFTDLAQTWLETATQDLAHAKSAQELGFFPHACFSCQQAVEKALKAYLFAQRQLLIRTHDLVNLLSHCIRFDESFEELSEAFMALNEYYVDTRYPDTLKFGRAFSREETGIAVTYAEKALGTIHSRITPLLDGEMNSGD